MIGNTDMKAYRASVEQVARYFGTRVASGLSHRELDGRRAKYGRNTFPEAPRETWVHIFLRQFQSPLIYILLIAAAIIFFAGPDKLDAFIISGVLFFNAIIGTLQEGKTQKILESLQQYLVSTSLVLRDGKKVLVEDADIVVGDIIILQEGQRVPADARIIESNNLYVEEAALTGESTGVSKTVAPIEKEVPIGDRNNMVYKGTHILSGSGKAMVIAVGVHTEVGKIQQTVQEIETDMPLKRELDRLSYWILLFILAMCLGMFILGLWYGKPLQELLVMLTALFICVVPEGLPVVLTLVLVRGVYQMAQRNVLIKRMQAVEALGRTDVILIDKTGTLTRNEMMVEQVIADDVIWQVSGNGYHETGDITSATHSPDQRTAQDPLFQMGVASLLLNNTEIVPIPEQNRFEIKGDPTEAALSVFAKKLGDDISQTVQSYEKIYELPFSSETRYHAGFFAHNGEHVAYIIGAPEELFKRAKTISENMRKQTAALLEQGLRVVACGRITFDTPPSFATDHEERAYYESLIEHGITMLGLCGMQDAIRSDVKDIIAQTRSVGIQVVMVTGDHRETAEFVAKRVGLLQKDDVLLEGYELEKMSDEELRAQLNRVTVCTRVSPEDKLRIVQLFQKNHKLVAMTGDGINDAPSLVAADLGIAMGRIGTEVAKEASDMILLDDSFASIINAIEQGRYIFDSLKRVVLYFFATNMAEILIVLCALFINTPTPITAAQILWLNLVTDGFLDVALSMEPQEPGLLNEMRTMRKVRLVDRALLCKMMCMAIPMAIGSLYMFLQYVSLDMAKARTMTMITMAMFQWFNAWNCRSQHRSLYALGLFSNKWLIAATSFVFLLQLAVVNVPVMQHIFKTVPLSLYEWISVLFLSSSIVWIEEVRKYIVARWMMLSVD